ncbi:hypothetical protein VTK73DRAFT_5158 [Phialemonium thermophilum]|uniref:Uncharacterized protein n=1 Tax=Phialemonium thermophilum TaxID=223376 RepID=A0ABR3XXN7_9PEZI
MLILFDSFALFHASNTYVVLGHRRQISSPPRHPLGATTKLPSLLFSAFLSLLRVQCLPPPHSLALTWTAGPPETHLTPSLQDTESQWHTTVIELEGQLFPRKRTRRQDYPADSTRKRKEKHNPSCASIFRHVPFSMSSTWPINK